ncbi:MAG: beta-ketoacyl-ACP synthase II [Proteobacteria bacterium]|nr:beta-ketoacyl-ACP synthase II [Pseudomonadota bacterium]NIS71699.1 beta-ketoacyl-ACP synthase II [Pseudomonadota bacterium]
MDHRVVVTGMGAITPIGIGNEVYWENLLAGVSGVKRLEFPDVDMNQYRTQIAAPVDDFDPEQFVPLGKESRYLGRTSKFALAATKLALENADFEVIFGKRYGEISGVDPFKIGVILGVAGGNVELLEVAHRVFVEDHGPRRGSPHTLPYYLLSAVSATIGIKFSCHGMNYAVPTACSSASQAIGNSFRHLRNGWEDMIITGGADACITPVTFGGFVQMRAMSTRNHDPEKASRPFDRERDGFVMGEGGGILILEKLEHALKRNAPIYAEIIGFGMTSDAYHITVPETEGYSFVKAIEMALYEAGIGPDEIDYINAHGTSTKLNDPIETRAIKTAFGKRAYEIPISSTKSMIGHLLGAAGGVETIATILTIRDGTVHPTINYEFPDPECDLDYVPNKSRKVPVRTAMSTSLGFGGFNSVLILRQYEG